MLLTLLQRRQDPAPAPVVGAILDGQGRGVRSDVLPHPSGCRISQDADGPADDSMWGGRWRAGE